MYILQLQGRWRHPRQRSSWNSLFWRRMLDSQRNWGSCDLHRCHQLYYYVFRPDQRQNCRFGVVRGTAACFFQLGWQSVRQHLLKPSPWMEISERLQHRSYFLIFGSRKCPSNKIQQFFHIEHQHHVLNLTYRVRGSNHIYSSFS